MAAPKGNLFALGNKGGHPPLYDTPESLADKAIEYFNYCEEHNMKVTLTGCVLYLGFCSRQSLADQEKRSEEFSAISKRIRLAIENSYEMKGNAIDIFMLKNMGYSDHATIDHTNNGTSFNHYSDEQLITIAAKLLDSKSEG